MTETTVFNIGDIIATIVILGFPLFLIVLVIGSVVVLAKKNKRQQAHKADLKNRIDALELRVETLENER